MSERPRFAIAASPGFILGVGVLLANDHILKSAFPGVITGKLSDVAGLFVAGSLTLAVRPSRPAPALGGVVLTFVFWKSPLSQPLIDAWNAVAPFTVARVVDWTDLLALPATALALVYTRSAYRALPPQAIVRTAMLGLAALAVVATSKAPPRGVLPNDASAVAIVDAPARYVTPLAPAATKKKLASAGFHMTSSWLFHTNDINAPVRCGVDDSRSGRVVGAETRIAWKADHTEISLYRLALCRRSAATDRAEALAAFEREVLVHLPDVRRIDPGRAQ